MKAVILAAGKGTRMQPLTAETPKPLLPVAGKPLIQHSIDTLRGEVDEIVIVAGYMIQQFRERYSGDEDIRIIEQQEPLGTADAALKAREHVEAPLILNGDDIYGEKLLDMLGERKAVLAARADNPGDFGVYTVEDGKVTGITEKPENPDSDLVNTGCFKVQGDFFSLLEKVEKSRRGEYEITDALQDYLEGAEFIEADRWMPCSYPWQLLDANEKLLEDLERRIEGEVHESASVKGRVVIEEGAEIREHTTIEGPAVIHSGCSIGPSAYIRPYTVLHENVTVGRSELKNSVVRSRSAIPHFNYIGDSYLDRDVNIGAGTKTANKRGDGKTVAMEVKGELKDSQREKLGAVIGTGAKIGMNCSIKPGRKVGAHAVTDSHEKISSNLGEGEVLKDGEIL
ncbi:MAG: bifunctional sugar-1-phosphate nucleotidylyltransferase/acetyltransferase [Candidatus Nanohaloarchaea archaeon]